jgi:hypothetical protein
MRLGFNPHKDTLNEKTVYNHQIIIPVYIPNQEGYFKDSFKVFRICLESLFKTVHDTTFITIVNNGSCREVISYLDELFVSNKINELIHTENIGKLNAILKGLAGNEIELVTIADSDVLFLNNWQNETVNVFNSFPKAGVVGIVPQFRTFGYFCGNLIVEQFFSKKLKFSPVKNVEGLKKFYYSLGWKEEDFNKNHLELTLTLESNSKTAVVGSGHFVATYKKEIFNDIRTYIEHKLGGESEKYLDKILLKFGLWRLTTYDNYAYHMGNVYEEWMDETLNSFEEESVKAISLTKTRTLKREGKIWYYLKNVLFVKFFKKRKYKKLFYQFKGMPKQMIGKY